MIKRFSLVAILAAFICISSFVSSANFELDEEVLVLTEANFDEAIESNTHILVEFYAPWCGHCKSLAPHYAKAAQALKSSGSLIKLAKVDATVEKNLGERFGIQGFPTLKFFTSGHPVEYNGGRTSEDIVSWVTKKSGPSTHKLNSVEEAEEFIKKNPLSVFYFGKEEGDLYSAFNKASSLLDGAGFAHINNAQANEHFATSDNTVVFFKDFDEKRNNYNGATNADDLLTFIEESSIPLVSGFTEATAEYIFGKSKTGLFLYRDPSKHSTLDTIMVELAPKYKGKISFVATGIHDELEEKLAEYIGITDEHLPTVRIHEVNVNEVKKYSLKGEITKQSVEQFLNDYASGKLTPEYKSEPIPEPNDEAVVTVVGLNFDTVVMDSTKDVLVEFYAPWCGHCKALAPKLENFAKTIKSYNSFVIAKVDATANEIPGVEIEGYPTLKFYPAKNKTPVDVDGARDEAGLLEFLKGQDTLHKIGAEVVFVKNEADEHDHHGHHHHGHDHHHDHDHDHDHHHHHDHDHDHDHAGEEKGDL